MGLKRKKNLDDYKQKSDINKLKELYKVGPDHLNLNKNEKTIKNLKKKLQKQKEEFQEYLKKQREFIKKEDDRLKNIRYCSTISASVSKVDIPKLNKASMDIITKPFVSNLNKQKKE